MILDETITLEQLYKMFSELKQVKYDNLPVRISEIQVNSHMAFNALQKELYAQSRVEKN